MKLTGKNRWIIGVLLLGAVAAYAKFGRRPEPVTQVIQVFITATGVPSSTPTLTSTPTPTPTPTLTPTPTSTPTATALPVNITGDPAALRGQPPVPQFGAPCGIADTFDFPLDPPDAGTARGGGDFGVFRNRYDKYHAGEDWRYLQGSNFGKPVYSVGHGQVLYAQPNGWGLDKGVIIIKHILQDQGYVYSFYGHLDPPSVTLRAGACVLRGDKIAEIGRPRTSPHLHFEMRLHLPDTPGPGYWSVDPTRAGWLPPSQTIWSYRMETSPGVQWVKATGERVAQGFVVEDQGLFITSNEKTLTGISLADGRMRWTLTLPGSTRWVQVGESGEIIYALTPFGELSAYALPSQGGAPEILWEIDLDARSITGLFPLPGGGIAIAARSTLTGIDLEGNMGWEHPLAGTVADWAVLDDQMFLTTSGSQASIWSVTSRGASLWESTPGGELLAVDGVLYLYTATGLFRLDPGRQVAHLLYPLANTQTKYSDITALPGGGILLAHRDAYDRRLLAFSRDGTLLWERSLKRLPAGTPQFFTVGDQVGLLLAYQENSAGWVQVYTLDPETGALVHVFEGGSRTRYFGDSWAVGLPDWWVLVNPAGEQLVALDLSAALEKVTMPLETP